MSLPTNAEESLLITAEGYDQLCRELDTLRHEGRRLLLERLHEARQDADLADSPTLQGLLDEQQQLERRIALLETKLSVAEIAAPAARGEAGVGTVVRIRDEDGQNVDYELVGPLESDIGNRRISISAPVGRALLGRRAGARVEVSTPLGRRTLHVVSIRTRPTLAEAAA